MQNSYPFVSVVIPCRNEEQFIGRCLDSVLATNYPADRMEILVADGMSNDKTRDIIKGYAEKYPSVKMLDNPDLFVSHALNMGIRHSCGELIIIMGAHSVYDIHFIRNNVEQIINHKEVDCVGGICITKASNQKLMSRAIATALSSPFGVGNAYFRIGCDKQRYVDTVPFGCYRKEVFSKIGNFDEDLTRGQDGEFNARLIKRGGKILLHPDIKSFYYARDSIVKLSRMYFQYGYFKAIAARKNKRLFAVRQLVPPLFVACLLMCLFLSVFSKIFFYGFLSLLMVYLLASFASAVRCASNMREAFVLPFIFFAMHFAWGSGFLKSFVDFIILRRENNSNLKDVSLTR